MERGGVYEKVERGVFFVKKSGKWEVFFCKKVDLSSTQGALCTVSVFFILHFTYSGGAYAPAPPAYVPETQMCII